MEPTAGRGHVRRRSSIRTRIGLLVAGLVGVVVLIFAGAAYLEVRESAMELAGERMFGAAEQFATSLSGTGEQLLVDVRSAAADPAVATFLADPTPEAHDAALEAIRLAPTSGSPVAELRDLAGNRLLATDTLLPSLAAGELGPPSASRADPWVGPLVADSAFGEEGAVFYSASIALGTAATPLGTLTQWRRVATAPATRETLQELIDPSAQIFLTNADGGVWTDFGRPVPSRSIPEGAFEDRRLQPIEAPESGAAFVAAAPAPPNPWFVVVQLSRESVLAGPDRVLRWLLLFGAILLVSTAAAAWFLGGRLTLGLVALSRAAGRISEGDFEPRVEARGSDEFAALAGAFNTMAENVDETQRALREKVAELSVREAEAREVRDQLEHLISSSRAILFSHPSPDSPDANGPIPNLRWISDNVRWILAHEPADARTPGWWKERIHPDDVEEVGRGIGALGSEEFVVLEYWFRHGAGEYRRVRDERRIRSDGRDEVVGVLTDITERHEMEAAQAAAEGANRAKTEFLSRMSHELRTPLTAVLGFAQLLEEEVTDEGSKKNVAQVLKAGEHLLGLIEEVLDLSGIEAGRAKIVTREVDVDGVVQESLELVRFLAGERGIAIEATPPESDATLRVRADRQRLRQILVNLLTNGIKYNGNGGRVTVRTWQPEPDRVRIEVEDTGPGIAESELHRLFVPFDRMGMEEKEPEGTGLGLPLSRTLAEAMEGVLEVESRVGEGSRFWVELYGIAVPAGSESAEGPEQESHTQRERTIRGTVLLVEDHPANIALVRRILERLQNVRLLVASRGDEGIEMAVGARPDMVLLDIHLPDMRGDEVLAAIRSRSTLDHTRVVILSGDTSPDQAERLLALGAHDYLFKPFRIHELLQIVDRILG